MIFWNNEALFFTFQFHFQNGICPSYIYIKYFCQIFLFFFNNTGLSYFVFVIIHFFKINQKSQIGCISIGKNVLPNKWLPALQALYLLNPKKIKLLTYLFISSSSMHKKKLFLLLSLLDLLLFVTPKHFINVYTVYANWTFWDFSMI